MTRLYTALGILAFLILSYSGLWLWGQQGHQKAARATNEAQMIRGQRDTAESALRLYARNAEITRTVISKRLEAETRLRKEGARGRCPAMVWRPRRKRKGRFGEPAFSLDCSGGASQIRTVDLRIKSPLLYQLS